jgi:hypothetical protein
VGGQDQKEIAMSNSTPAAAPKSVDDANTFTEGSVDDPENIPGTTQADIEAD